jgi:hypothetical protein
MEIVYKNESTGTKSPTETQTERERRANIMYVKFKSPEEAAKFLRFQVEIAGGEEKLLDGQQRTGRMYMQEN